MEIWALKLLFLLIFENMFKSIATAHREHTTKHGNKASYNTDYVFPDLIDFFFWRLKRDQNTDWKKEYLYLWKILYWIKITFLLLFSMNFLVPYGKTMSQPFAVSSNNQNQIHYFKNFLVTKCLRKALSNKFFVQKLLPYFCFELGCFQPNRLKSLL